MRFIVLIKANADTEAGLMPDEKLLAEMGRFNEELVQAGVMQSGEGLQPSSKGARVRFKGGQREVVDGPFAETKELIAGFWIWQLPSMKEALAWAQRCPNPTGAEGQIEIRPVFEADDFGAEFTPELREQDERLRAQLKVQQTAAMQPVPAAQGATPYLIIRDAAAAITYYQQAFGAELLLRLDAPDGKVMHAELRVGPARFMLTEERPQHGAQSPLALGGSASSANLYFTDVDAQLAKAQQVDARLKITMPLQDQFWGDRSVSICDPFGHNWMLATHKEDPTPAQLQQRLAALFSKPQAG